jgi:hypothetical protein
MMNVHHRGEPQFEGTAHRLAPGTMVGPGKHLPMRTYSLVVTTIPDGSMQQKPLLALRRHLPLLEYLGQRIAATGDNRECDLDADAEEISELAGLAFEKVRPLLYLAGNTGTRHGHPLLRPLVLRASRGASIQLQITNLLPASAFSFALVDDDYGIQSVIDARPAVLPGQSDEWTLHCTHAGIFPLYNRACPNDAQRRCLLGVLIVEP